MSERNCGTCLHRAYGDQRLISQCALKVFGDPDRKREMRFNGRYPAPKARNFGRKCMRWKLQTENAIPTALRMVGVHSLEVEARPEAKGNPADQTERGAQ